MSSKTQSIVWIKKPLAVYAENAEEGVVIQGEKILELVPQGQNPKSQIDEVYDASDSVLLPGPVSYTHLTLPTILRV